ncbi:MAG: CPBP family intramembrane glutamic endopeptidase [Phycisphaerales bacterium]
MPSRRSNASTRSTRSSKGRRRRPRSPGGSGLAWYLELSHRPLQILLFLLPLVVFYELGLWFEIPGDDSGRIIDISAHRMLEDLYAAFDVSGLYLPGITIVVILLIWHVLSRHRWELHLGVPALMLLEAAALALPLIVIDQLLRRLDAFDGGLAAATALLGPSGIPQITELSWQARVTLSVGAGLYEELVFRMALMAAVHALLVDLLGISNRRGAVVSILVSALAFTAYHDLTTAAGGFDLPRALFLFVAGLYFAFVYATRGFGVVVGAHVVYDILATVALPALADAAAPTGA